MSSGTPRWPMRRILLIVFLALLGLGAAAIVRLAVAPVSLAHFRPRIEHSLAEAFPEVQVRLGDIHLAWSSERRKPAIHTRSIQVQQSDGSEVASLAGISVGLSPVELLRGRLKPAWIELNDITVRLLRGDDGDLGFVLGPTASVEGADDLPPDLPDNGKKQRNRTWMYNWVRQSIPDGPLSRLRSIRIHPAKVELLDRNLRRHGAWKNADLEIDLTSRGAKFRILAELDDEHRDATFRLEADYRLENESVRAELDLAHVRPSRLSQWLPQLGYIGGLDFPVSGSLKLESSGKQIHRIDAEIEADSGRLSLPFSCGDPVPLRSAKLMIRIRDHFERIELVEGEVRLDDPAGTRFDLSMALTRQEGGYAGEIRTEAPELSIPAILSLWPANRSTGARAFVAESIPEGILSGVQASARLEPAGADGGYSLGDLEASFAFGNMSVDCLRPQASIDEVNGRGTFRRGTFSFAIEKGRFGAFKLGEGLLDLTGIGTGSVNLVLSQTVHGPVPDALDALTRKPIAVLTPESVAPAGDTGVFEGRLFLGFPLPRRGARIQVACEARTRESGWRLDRFALSRITAELAYRDEHLLIAGQALCNGIPSDVRFEHFPGDDSVENRIGLEMRLDEAGRTALGLPLIPFLTEAVDLKIVHSRRRDGAVEILTDIDLTDGVLDIPRIGWGKAQGTSGRARIAVRSTEEGEWRADSFEVTAPGLHAHGSMSLRMDPLLFSIDVDSLRCGDNMVHGTVERSSDALYEVSLAGPRLELRPLLRGMRGRHGSHPTMGAGGTAPSEADTVVTDGESDPPGTPPRVETTFRFDEVLLDGKALVDSTLGQATFLGNSLELLRVDSGSESSRSTSISYERNERGREWHVQAWDVSRWTDALSLPSNLERGDLEVSAASAAPGAPLEGTVILGDFHVSESPMLAKILTLSSFDRLFKTFTQSGLDFGRFESRFRYFDSTLEVYDGYASGDGIGITLKGTYDLNRKVVDIKGAVAPLSTIQRLLGKIPLVGLILAGVDNEGIIAAIFKVTGPASDPDVDVQTLSSLTPGITRDLLNVITGD